MRCLKVLFYQLDCYIAGTESLGASTNPLFLYSSLIYSPLIFLGVSQGRRQFWCQEDLKDRLGAHCGAGWVATSSLPGQPASFLCCLDQSLADGLYNDDCRLGRLQTTSNS